MITDNSHTIIPKGVIVYINVFGEPFFDNAKEVFKISPETGEREIVCQSDKFNLASLDNYWTGDSLKQQWEAINGLIQNGHYLVPITPFTLGGEFEIANLMCIPEVEMIGYYKKIRDAINILPDGAAVQIKIKL